jgi:hypothetical protein
MSKYILIDGDVVNFNPAFGLATVMVTPGILQGGGGSTLQGKPVCIEGDEKNVSVAGCSYTAGPFSIPGTGTMKIESLGSDQIAKKTKSAGKAVLLRGSLFTAKFEVQKSAEQPASPKPIPDPNSQYLGNGTFQTMNTKWQGE